MPDDAAKPRLELVPKPQRVKTFPFEFSEPGAQGLLFPVAARGLLIFVHFPDVTEQEFRETIEHAHPSYVLELRASPRFDIGNLNRRLAFQVFQRENTTYLDLTSASMGTMDAEGIISGLRRFFQTAKPLLDRPIVFLIHRSESNKGLVSRVLETFAAFGTQPSRVFEIPSIAGG